MSLKVSTYKVNFHHVNSSREGLRERILRDPATDVWCIQGANLSKQLKALPDPSDVYYAAGMAMMHNNARVERIEADNVNLAQSLLVAAEERQCVGDVAPVSRLHMSKLKIFVGFAAYRLRAQAGTTPSTSSSTSLFDTAPRVLVVNVDFERFYAWGAAFQCSLLRVLFRHIWDDARCFTKRWNCTHVCIAGSFFFTPCSVPYQLMTSLSGGCVEEVAAHALVPLFRRVSFDEVESAEAGGAGSSTVHTCVVAADVGDENRCRQLLGLQVRRSGADGAVVAPLHIRLSQLNARTGEYEAEERIARGEDGWYTLAAPRDATAVDSIVLRLEWLCEAGQLEMAEEEEEVWCCLRVRSFGVLPPQRQDAEGLCVGKALLQSGAAGTVSPADAALFAEAMARGTRLVSHVASLVTEARIALGEPVVTAVYRDGTEVLPDCYDYVFVTAFTGAVVQEASRLTMADFEAEAATPHLPVSCTFAIPNAGR